MAKKVQSRKVRPAKQSEPTPPGKALQITPKALSANFQPDALISATTFKKDGQPRGKSGIIFLKPLDDGDGGVGDDNGTDHPPDPCRGRVFIDAPMIAAQLDLAATHPPADCPSPHDRQRIAQAVKTQFSLVLPNAEVEVPPCVNNILTVVVWSSSNTDACGLKARKRGVDRLKLTTAGWNFGYFMNASLIYQQALSGFSSAYKDYDSSGRPSAGGPIHVTSLTVDFVGPDTVKTVIKGFDERPWPDVDFTLTIADVLEQQDLHSTTTSNVDTDKSAWTALLSLGLLSGATYFLPVLLPLTLFVFVNDLDAVINQGGDTKTAGVGARALELVPRELPLPGPDKKKLKLSYVSTQVTAGGLFFGAVALPINRTPDATITGRTTLTVADNAKSTFGFYEVIGTDTIGALSVNWVGGPGISIQNPTQPLTKITFARGTHTADDPPFTRTLRATATDQDGFVKTLIFEVAISVVPGDEVTPICRAKPWLPQCQ